ncbi:hypothetical protein SPRG_05402 [Saprolegnia parasitica CBS 223.65]|uniref:Uncharacterized protein n=1 Tax=Saprolegnia parasitica (strain CBS 223.65) TaxID=695850 RepID=A0A067CF93_SAPPC|nr:hypothetical protein SPRG_05402 [Saprolegnia parasitica CBS 223.65]KDO29158.1 hypothetical protein SPRG_05402 [Saprolegnia parasitica CBS 223.65]|eukprot:XP_012200037.1 hypothetical protein SPRG_05402 [Saprolegnia parasitica CBS 223.65]
MELLDLLPVDDGALAFLDDVAPPKVPKRVRKKTLARDVAALQDEEASLQVRLCRLQSRHSAKALSFWGRHAMGQHAQLLRARHTNAVLRALLSEQRVARAHLENALRTWPTMLDAQRPFLALCADAAPRVRAMHAIADRQFDVVESEMIATGLLDPDRDIFRIQLLSDAHMLSSQGARYTTFPNMSLAAVDAAILEVLRHRSALVEGGSVTDARASVIDATTLYTLEVVSNAAVHVTTRMLVKRYAFDGRITYVWRSVLDDEAHPVDGYVNDEHGWICIEANRSDVVYRAYLKAASPRPAPDGLAGIETLLRQLNVGKSDATASLDVLIQSAFTTLFRRLEASILERASRPIRSPEPV